MIILKGKSGSGKTYIKSLLLQHGFENQVSYTTRAKRPNEVDGIDYCFVDEDLFIDMIHQGKFKDYQYFHNSYYGTLNIPYDSTYVSAKSDEYIPSENDLVIYVDSPIQTRYFRMINRGDSKSDIFYRLHIGNFDGLQIQKQCGIVNTENDNASTLIDKINVALNGQFKQKNNFVSNKNSDQIMHMPWPQTLKFLAIEECAIKSFYKSDRFFKLEKDFYYNVIQKICKKFNFGLVNVQGNFEICLDGENYPLNFPEKKYKQILEQNKNYK